MNEVVYLTMAILVMALVMFGLRAFPFLLFGRGQQPPELIRYLGERLTPATIAMLVVYCLNPVQWTTYPSALPEAISMAAIVAVHVLFRNALLSIFGGTILYMVLVQLVFS